MKFIKTNIDGVIIVKPQIFKDKRGYFTETYNEEAFINGGIPNRFIQDNQSKSSYGVVRGLHCQLGKYSQAKLVRVLQGTVLDVAVDVRPGSETFGQYVAVKLSARNKLQLFIPRYFLHGFIVLSKTAIFAYKVDNIYAPQAEFGIRYDDPEINVNWGIPKDKIITSKKDTSAHTLQDLLRLQKENTL
jgi:dTDP-4-dehydrorhamnose 3,5-epimerase